LHEANKIGVAATQRSFVPYKDMKHKQQNRPVTWPFC